MLQSKPKPLTYNTSECNAILDLLKQPGWDLFRDRMDRIVSEQVIEPGQVTQDTPSKLLYREGMIYAWAEARRVFKAAENTLIREKRLQTAGERKPTGDVQ